MPFPSTQDEMFKAGYEYSTWQKCPACSLDVEVWTTPGKRTILMDPMPGFQSLAVRHLQTCRPVASPKTQQAPAPPSEAQGIKMYGVNDPNHQLLSVGYETVDGVLVCQFKTAKWSYAGVPEAEFLKLKKVPFAYRIFTTNIKGKYPATKLS